mgnify:FL=1
MSLEVGGILGFIVLICIIYAIVKTLDSRADTGTKVVWVLVLLVLPVIGFVLWLFFGPR